MERFRLLSIDDLDENTENKTDRLTQILNKLSTLTTKQERDITDLKRRLDNRAKEDYSGDKNQ